jgi:hypothetical protein
MGGARILIAAVAASMALPASANAEIGEQRIPMYDGISLEAVVLRPDGVTDTTPTPVVFDAGPYFSEGQMTLSGNAGAPAPGQPAEYGLRQAGYTVVRISLRGYGNSGGCWNFHGDADRADMRAVVDWLQAQPWSDGHVAAVGFSYDGGAAADAIAGGADLDAAILQAPQVLPYSSLYLNGLRTHNPYTAPLFGPGLSFMDASGPDGGDDQSENLAAADPACWAAMAAGASQTDRTSRWWRERDGITAIGSTDVPVLLSYGFQDDQVKGEALLPLWKTLGSNSRAWFGQFDHTPPDSDEIWPPAEGDPSWVGRDGYAEQKVRFLDRHLRGTNATEPEPNVVVQEGATGAWRGEAVWPPLDSTTATIDLLAGSYEDVPGNTADGRGNPLTQNNPPATQGQGSWTFSAPLEKATHLAGEPKVTVDATALAPTAHLNALLYDVAADGTATLVSRHAAYVAASGPTELTLYAQDWRFAAGHRIGILISGAEDSWVEPPHTGQTVTISGGTLALPVLGQPHADDLEGDPSYAMAIRQPFSIAPATITSRTAAQTSGI